MKSIKKIVWGILFIIFLSSFSFTSLAHSGRTDSSGGHHDYKNKSGLGSYHYHHGLGPHLHPGGVCPYSGGTTDNSTATTDNSSTATDSSGSSSSQASTYTPPAPSISIKNYPKTLDVGASAGFEYSVSNATSDDSTVTSSDSNIVKVNANGTLTAVSEGNAQITIKASGATKTFNIKVNAVPVDEIKISNIIEQLQLGEKYQFQTKILPTNATNKTVSWSSDNEDVVEINNSGVVTTKSTGIATVTVTTENNLEAKAIIAVYEVLPETIDCEESINLIVGDEDTYEINILPENSNRKDFTVVCDNENIFKYSDSSIYAISEGETTLHIETWNGVKKDIPIKVDIIPIEKIDIRDSTDYLYANIIDKSSKISLSTEIIPNNATYQEIVWNSSDDDIVSIQDNSFIINDTGKVTLTCTAHGDITGSIDIIIINKNLIITIFLSLVTCIITITTILIKTIQDKSKTRLG